MSNSGGGLLWMVRVYKYEILYVAQRRPFNKEV